MFNLVINIDLQDLPFGIFPFARFFRDGNSLFEGFIINGEVTFITISAFFF